MFTNIVGNINILRVFLYVHIAVEGKNLRKCSLVDFLGFKNRRFSVFTYLQKEIEKKAK